MQEPPAALADVLKGLLDSEWQQTAIPALGNLGAQAAPAIAAMSTQLASADAETQALLLNSLERIGLTAQPALPAIRKLAGSDNTNVKTAADKAVAAIEEAIKIDQAVQSGKTVGAGADVPENASGPPPEAPAVVNPVKDLEIDTPVESTDVKTPDASEIPDLPATDEKTQTDSEAEKKTDAETDSGSAGSSDSKAPEPAGK